VRKLLESDTVSIGLAIFSMLFGAGNLMFPIKVGMSAGPQNIWGMLGFTLTAVMLPVFGLISMVLFEGDYRRFFSRLGSAPGKAIVYICMLIIGPGLAMPRIVTLSHTMMYPFLPEMSALVFALLFLGVTFLFTFRENRIVELLGKYISPALLVSLVIIIAKGLFFPGESSDVGELSKINVFTENLVLGYGTLDLLGGLFFASIVLTILKNKFSAELNEDPRKLASISLKAGLLGTSLLGLVYLGLSYLGVYHGLGLENVNLGELFREISFRVLGQYGAFIVATAVLMACLSTSIALAAVLAEFIKEEFNHKIKFVSALVFTLIACLPLSIFGLGAVLKLTAGPITFIGYPILIAITFLNIAYKLFGFKPIKIPVLVTGLISILFYLK
jgi:branched-chain amino acid:cation transporter, LIVCS family